MSNINKEYNDTVTKRNEVKRELFELEDNEIVKRYLELVDENEELEEQEKELYIELKKEEYISCKHLTVYSKMYHDCYEHRTYKNCACMKCGLDSTVLDYDKVFLIDEEKAMYDILKNNEDKIFRNKTEVICDINLAKAIYQKIKEKHPGISDKLARKYFEIALDNIRNIKVSDERKESRAKRLNLEPKFNRWNAKDVIIDK